MIDVCRADYLAVCHTCRQRHPCFTEQGFRDYCVRHPGHSVSLLQRDALGAKGNDRLAAWDPRRLVRSGFGAAAALALRLAVGDLRTYSPNSDVKEAFQSAQSMTVTNLHSLASSATAGWQSAAVDNGSNLYLDDLWQVIIDHANTAPANSKGHYILAYHALESAYSNPFSGSEGTLTILDITTTQQAAAMLGFLPYTTADEVAESRLFSMAATAGGILPPKSGVGIINHSGAAIAASGNTVKHSGVYATVI